MSVRSEVLLWAQRTLAKGKDAPPHQLLELQADAGIDDAQAAFHRIARMAHPDLHRMALTPEELELVTSAFSRITAAYEDLRSRRMSTARMRALGREPAPAAAAPAPAPEGAASAAPAGKPAPQMSSKALVYYRKAELALRRGDLTGAVLQLKMAIAADPQSPVLRTALAEVQAEVSKKATDLP